MIFETRIAGIPCKVNVTLCTAPSCGRLGHYDDWLPDEPGEFEFDVLDRHGRRADWLRAKMDWRDEVRFQEEYEAICAMETA